MRIRIAENSASSLALLAVTTRAFYGLAIDMPELYNSGWLAVLFGGVLALPLAWAAGQLRSRCGGQPAAVLSQLGNGMLWRGLAGILAITAGYDAAFVTSAIAGSASYIALNSISLFYLLLPQLALVFWCLTRSGDAIGASAGIWNRILPWLIVLVVLLQLREYRPSWLTPIFGPGMPTLLDGALRIAGWFGMLVGLFLIAERDDEGYRPMRPVRLLGLCTLMAALLGGLRGMMIPPLLGNALSSRFFQLDALLSNGRSPLSLQLPLTALWFLSLFYLLLFDAFLCSAMMQQLIPKLKKVYCVLATIGIIIAFILCRLTSREVSAHISGWLYALQSTVLIIAMAAILFRKEGGRRA